MAVRTKLINNYWHIQLPYDKKNVRAYRVHYVTNGVQRLATQDKQGRWHTSGWRIHRNNVRVYGRTLVANNQSTARILNNIRSKHGAIII